MDNISFQFKYNIAIAIITNLNKQQQEKSIYT